MALKTYRSKTFGIRREKGYWFSNFDLGLLNTGTIFRSFQSSGRPPNVKLIDRLALGDRKDSRLAKSNFNAVLAGINKTSET